jgi:hypothetical protein
VTAFLVFGRITDALSLFQNCDNIEIFALKENALLLEIVAYEALLLADGLGSAIYFL